MLALATSLAAIPSDSAGAERAMIDDRVDAATTGFTRPKVAAGLAKLLTDRIEFEEPSDEGPELRASTFAEASRLLRSLDDDATPGDYERLLSQHFPDLERRRERLYADHPQHRRMLSWDPVDGPALVDRYNLALVQGVVMRARRIEIEATAPELLRVRRLLRWLKFSRLVGEVTRTGRDWRIVVEGPAEILAMQKKYGLQLAIFIAAVPVLQRFRLSAEVRFEHGAPALLELDESAPLVSPQLRTLGHVPEEIGVIVAKLSDETWEADPSPLPRTVGKGALCVPDLLMRRKSDELEVAFEFFHRWHRHQLSRRLEDLRIRPDPKLLLAVDESLLAGEPDAADHPQVMPFKGFPSERRLRAMLTRFD